MSFKGATFDLDGVIVNTVPLHYKAWKRMFSEYGKEFTFTDYKEKVDGILRLDGAKAILTGLKTEELEIASSKKEGYYLELLKAGTIDVYESTIYLIRELKRNNIKIAAASSSRSCRLILERSGLKELFDVVIGGGDFDKGKPEPDIFILAAEELKIIPAEMIVFEDAKLGIEAAKRGSMLCVGIARDGDLSLLKDADIVVEDLDEIDYTKLNQLFKKNEK